MANITLKGNPIQTSGNLPAIGSKAQNFALIKNDLSEANLTDYFGSNIILNIFSEYRYWNLCSFGKGF